jgi:hypothetical protein
MRRQKKTNYCFFIASKIDKLTQQSLPGSRFSKNGEPGFLMFAMLTEHDGEYRRSISRLARVGFVWRTKSTRILAKLL